jgi:hypothetical protein
MERQLFNLRLPVIEHLKENILHDRTKKGLSMSLQSIDSLLDTDMISLVPELARQMDEVKNAENDRKTFFVLPSPITVLLATTSNLAIPIQMNKEHGFLASSFGIISTDSAILFNIRIAGEQEFLFSTDVSSNLFATWAVPVTINPPLFIRAGSGLEMRAINNNQATVTFQIAFFGYLVPIGESK